MPFHYIRPCEELTAYIHSYWTLTGSDEICDVLYPDGCIDIITNFGESFTVTQKGTCLETNKVYLGGAITEAIYEKLPVGVHLLGIRFKPGCFCHFFSLPCLGDFKDDCIAVGLDYLPSLDALKQSPVNTLDHFFCARLKRFDNPVKHAAETVIESGGNLMLSKIASACKKSHRQTERAFKRDVGLTPKQFCKVVKFSRAQELLEARDHTETLLGVAIDAGYYDHAHLTKEYKKIALRSPSQG